MQKTLTLIGLLLFSTVSLFAQKPKPYNATQIYEAIQKLNFLGSVLYVAAHPDDENTRLISYMSNHEKARTAYLSLTRGDGGQNLIGPELEELLGVIRTQELLAARTIDGGEQLFTRANDFGFSKHPDETLSIWDKDSVLSDVVWAIRSFKPDIIINRFDHRTPGKTHGHHTASALLSIEAFGMANNPTKFTKQLKYTSTWQPKRIFFNTSWWFYGSQEKFDEADKSKLLNVDIGVYYPLKGVSNNEIAALASSQHLCQGFGRLSQRGSQTEYLEFLEGEFPKDKTNLFDGIETTWNRVEGGNVIGEILYSIQENFNFNNPASHIPDLLKAYKLINTLKDKHWKQLKSKEIKEIILACAGLYLEASAESSFASPNETVSIEIEALNRSHIPIVLQSLTTSNNTSIPKNLELNNNQKQTFSIAYTIPENTPYTTPYWLKEKSRPGMYSVAHQQLIGLPETPKTTTIQYTLLINNTPLSITKPIVYRYAKPDKGELYKPFDILPKASVKLNSEVYIFQNDHQKDVTVTVKAITDSLSGYVSIQHPTDWHVYPEKQKFNIAGKGEIQNLVFTVIPPKAQSEGNIVPTATIDGEVFSKQLVEIDYTHIPFQNVLLPAEGKVVRLAIEKKGENIGYIIGAGDAVPESLQQIGYQVSFIDPNTLSAETLAGLDAVVIGIRAYNILENMDAKQEILFHFVENGGNLIVQYNTNRGIKTNRLAPYELHLSRDRVTNENSKVTLLHTTHELLNTPNKITAKDFDGWVQERGLYFPDSWADEFTPVLSMHDENETPKLGSLLVAKHGKGYYIYTGLSFFRELPNGVPGAYRLFANMLSIGKKADNNLQKLDD